MKPGIVLGILELAVGVFIFLFISIVLGITLLLVGVILIYFARRNPRQPKQAEPAGPPTTQNSTGAP